MSQLPLRCGGCNHLYTRARWETLPVQGYTCVPADEDGPATHLQYRTTPCCSFTYAVNVGPGHPGCELRDRH